MSCGSPITHNIRSYGCSSDENPQYCERSFQLYIPAQLCDQKSSSSSGFIKDDTVPLVFAFHCYGCNPDTMLFFTAVADAFGFVLVVPEGLKRSWNAKYCCGFSQENQINDVGFVSEILSHLTGFGHTDINLNGLVKSDFVYALGWSNGAYFVSYAAGMFRSIAPIAGHIYDLESDLPLSKFQQEDKDIGLFLHHSINDPSVRFTGCCTDAAMPKCCCNISNNQNTPEVCTSADVLFESWATKLNKCQAGDLIESFSSEEVGVKCQTFEKRCEANSTICIYENSGHFGNIAKSFPRMMQDEIGHFFATDACSMRGGGIWNRELKQCECDRANGGRFCYSENDSENHPKLGNSPSSIFYAASIITFLGMVLLLKFKVFSLSNRKPKEYRYTTVIEMNSLTSK